MNPLAAALLALQGAAPLVTLEQIMADPDWLGNAPTRPYWGTDSETVYYQQKRIGSELSDLFVVDSSSGSTRQVAESDFVSGSTEAGFKASVDKIKKYILDGDCMQVVLSLTTGFAIALSPAVGRLIDRVALFARGPGSVYFMPYG